MSTESHALKEDQNIGRSYSRNTGTKQIFFYDEKSINWYFADGLVKKITPFQYYPKQNIGNQFMNVNNDIATTLFACNNNVTLGDKHCYYYVTLYQSKKSEGRKLYLS